MKTRIVSCVLTDADELRQWKALSDKMKALVQSSPYVVFDLHNRELNSMALGHLGFCAREYGKRWGDDAPGIFLVGVMPQTEKSLSLLSLLRFFVIESDYNAVFEHIKEDTTNYYI